MLNSLNEFSQVTMVHTIAPSPSLALFLHAKGVKTTLICSSLQQLQSTLALLLSGRDLPSEA